MKDAVSDVLAEPITSRIADRVRALRSERGLSLEELAEKSAVSRSMLSLVERGESSPTAVVLDKIAAGLGVSLAVFFQDAADKVVPLTRSGDRQVWRDPQTGYLREVLSPSSSVAPFQLALVTLPAGRAVHYESVTRAKPYHQQIWMQDGRIELSVGAERYHLGEGDCVALEIDGRPVSFKNPSRRRARYAVIIAIS